MNITYRGKVWLAIFILMTSLWSSLIYVVYALIDL